MKKVFLNSSIVICSLAMAFFIGEMIARVILPPPKEIQIEIQKKDFSLSAPQQNIEGTDGSIQSVLDWSGKHGVRLNPNVTATIKNHSLSHQDVVIQTNSYGLRYKELSHAPSKGKRILFVGDSITFGDYLPQDETIPALVETDLVKSGNPVSVINAALPGANTSDELYHYLEIKDVTDPGLVLVGMYLNDAQKSENFYGKHLRYPFSLSRLLSFVSERLRILTTDSTLSQILSEDMSRGWRERFRDGRKLNSGDMLRTRDGFDFELYNAHQDFGLAWNPQSWTTLTQVAQLFLDKVQENGSRIAFVLYPIHIQVYADEKTLSTYPQEQYKKMCASLGIECLDLLPTLRNEAAAGVQMQEMFYDHCHLRTKGNVAVANAITDWLKNKNLLPLE